MAGNNAVTVEYVPEHRRAVEAIPERRRADDRPRSAEAGIAWHELITIHTTDDVIRRWWSDPRRDRRKSRR